MSDCSSSDDALSWHCCSANFMDWSSKRQHLAADEGEYPAPLQIYEVVVHFMKLIEVCSTESTTWNQVILLQYRGAWNQTFGSHRFYLFLLLTDLLQNISHPLHLLNWQWSLFNRGFIRFGSIQDGSLTSMMDYTLIEAEEWAIEVISMSNLSLKFLCSLV